MSNCQQCFQPLQIQQLFPQKSLSDSYDQLARMHEEGLGLGEEGGESQNNILEQDAIFFGQSEGATADVSTNTMLGLRIKDFAEQKNIQLKHPVCFECFEGILKQLEYKVKSQEQERDMYKAELQRIEEELAMSGGRQDEDLLRELQALEETERGLDEALEGVEKQEKTQQMMMKDLDKSKGVIQAQEDSIWRKVNDYERELSTQLESNKQVDGQIKNLTQLYKRLRQTNFINEVFHISSQDQFGTISGFRLGRINQLVDVEWDEINTALGQAAYLMAIIAHRFGYKFDKYKINLCGAMSTIQLRYQFSSGGGGLGGAQGSSQGKNPKYELYYGVQSASEDRFNTALEYLLDCLHGLMQDVRAKMSGHPSAQDRTSQQSLYRIEGAEIGGQSIRYKSADSQTWTLSMKYFLTNLQWLVYMTQLRDIADQQQNVNMETNSSNFNISGL